MGNSPGDVVIAIDRLTQASDVARLNNNDMILVGTEKSAEYKIMLTEVLLVN